MKVSVIWSSPNKGGLTNRAATRFIKGLEKAGEVYAEKLENGFNMYY